MTRSALLWVAALALGCGGDDDAGGPNSGAMLADGELCAPDFPDDCSSGRCEDVVSGQSSEGNTAYDWDLPAVEGTICTWPCDTEADCGGVHFADANEHEVAGETWTCVDGLCHVELTPRESSGGDLCSGCGGAFCSGDCIGCPQCS